MNKEQLQKIRLELSKESVKSQNKPYNTEVDEEFVIPSPRQGENKQGYVSRCIKALSKENKPQAQIAAICYAQIEKK